ncbi:MAG: S-layer homology domain-containing protein, partial [Evtepia sp.]
MKRKLLSLLLSLCLAFSLMPTASAATAFTDISDPLVARNVEVLRMLGVLNGISETQFDPAGTLTRAQFTKMAIMAQNQGSRIATYQNYTIFPDVKSGHWAAGYINLAVRGEKKFISGFANGTFAPDQIITFGQAVTILMRLLDYKDADVGMIWPDGYLDTAATIGLTKDVPLAAGDAIRRSDAAQLFVNLLTTKKKDGTATFAASIAGSIEENIILLNANEKEGTPAFETTKGTYPLAGTYVPTLLSGRKGTLMLDANGKVMSFLPSNVGSVKEITVSSAKAGTLKDTAGNSYTMTAKITAYERGVSKTYGDVFINIRPGTQVTLHIGQNGKVELLFIGDVAAEEAVVISKDGGGNFSLLTDRTDYSIYKGGEKVTASALRAYDVATYHAKENKIQISDTRVSGYYENAYPNTEAPSKITMLGNEFTVLASAIPTLSQFKVGSNITLLLTSDNQVAGAADSEKVIGNAIGLAAISSNSVKVTLPCGLVLLGKTDGDIASFDGQLVTVTSKKSGVLSVYPVKEKESKDSLNVAKRQLGSHLLAENALIYERIGKSQTSEIAYDEIRATSIPASKILYTRQ